MDNQPAAIEALVDELRGLGGADGWTVGVDVVGGIASLLAVMLQNAGVTVVHVPGLAVNRARQGTVGGRTRAIPVTLE